LTVDDMLRLRPLGRTALSVTGVGVGASPLGGGGGMTRIYGHDTTHDDGVATARRALDSPLNFLDTSNAYGDSERRIGAAIADRGGLPDGYVLATKVDADPETRAYDGARVRRSFETSLERLGVSRIQLLHLHDPDFDVSFEDSMAPGGAVEELRRLRDEGLVDHLGIATGDLTTTARYLETGVFDVVLTHNRYTLVDRSAERVIARAAELGIGVINAAPFGGGVLARRPGPGIGYYYGSGSDAQLQAVHRMWEVADAAGVPLAAAALAFAADRPEIDNVLVGCSRPDRIDELVRLAQTPLPDGLLAELDALCPPREHWLEP
jgi:D-threo-aldose 1-dehydrogenase